MDVINAIEVFKGAWPTIQPAISSAFSAVVATLFLRKNTTATEIERIKQSKFSDIADTLLAEGYITHLEYYKCRNFTNIAKKADEVYQKNIKKQESEEKPKEPIDFDWFVRFFEESGNISNEEMQDLWASVLAGEVKTPGSFSRKTLDVLRNLSQNDAKLFKELVQYVIPKGEYSFLFRDESVLLKHEVTFSKIVKLDYCGLINSQPLTVINKIGPNFTPFLYQTDENVCVVNPQTKDVEITLPAYVITLAGIELLEIINVRVKKEFLFDVTRALNNKKPYMKGHTATLHRIDSIMNTVIYYDKQPLSLEDNNNA